MNIERLQPLKLGDGITIRKIPDAQHDVLVILRDQEKLAAPFLLTPTARNSIPSYRGTSFSCSPWYSPPG